MSYQLRFIIAAVSLFYLVLPIASFAQGTDASCAVKFRCLSWEAPIRENIYVKSNGELQLIRIHNIRRSKEVDYIGENPLVFYRKGAGGQFEVVAEVALNTSFKAPLLFFVGSNQGYRVIPMEDSFDVYPRGSYRFYNFTDKKLMTKFGDETMDLMPKQTTVLEKPFNANTQYSILIVVRDSEGIKPLYSNVWRHNVNYRYVILISESESKALGPVAFRVLSDFED